MKDYTTKTEERLAIFRKLYRFTVEENQRLKKQLRKEKQRVMSYKDLLEKLKKK